MEYLKLNYGQKDTSNPSFIESDRLFITKPFDVANYFNYYFIGKLGKLDKQSKPMTNSEQLYSCIKKTIMNGKQCKFEFCKVSVGEVEKLLLTINNDKHPGIDNLDGKLLRMMADSKALSHIHI